MVKGFGSAYLARQVGQKFAREIFFLGHEYSADDAHRMGMVNAVVSHVELEPTALQWAKEINSKSPTAQRMLKYSFNLIDDGLVGQQLFAGDTKTRRHRARFSIRIPRDNEHRWHTGCPYRTAIVTGRVAGSDDGRKSGRRAARRGLF